MNMGCERLMLSFASMQLSKEHLWKTLRCRALSLTRWWIHQLGSWILISVIWKYFGLAT